MLKWNIRNQILGLGGVSLVVLIGVIVYFYTFSRSELIKSSQEALRLTNIQYADAIDRTFATQARTFNDWVREDVFGLAIEFSTTSELGQQFKQWMASSDAFAVVILTDQNGLALELAAAETASAVQVSKGLRVPDFTALSAAKGDAIVALSAETVKQFGLPWTAGYAFYHPARSSSGEVNGALIAICDWSQIQTAVDGCHEAVTSQGYRESLVLVGGPDVEARGPLALAAASLLIDPETLSSLADGVETAPDRSVVAVDIEQGTQFVAVSTLTPPTLSDDNKAGLYLLAVVPRSEVTSKLNSALVKILLGGSLGTLLLLGICAYLARSLSRRVSRGAEIAKAMAAGDVNREVDISGRDEIGALGEAFRELADYMRHTATAAERIAENDLTVNVTPKSENDILGNSFQKMVNNLTNIVRQLGKSSDELVTAANEVASSAEAMSSGATSQTDQMSQISTAIEEMTATIVESSKNAGEASNGAKGAAETANGGGLIVSETVQGMQRIASVVRQSAESIARLAKSADQIGEIVGVINDIADQTNLLALNAAIEAARAGEQGRGFAVVADEVRKLAERTSSATSEIAEMIKGIQAQTEDAVGSMESGIQEVDKGRELADRAGNSLTDIVAMSQRVTDMIQQIATATEEQSCAAEEISRSVEKVTTIAKESAGSAQRSATASEELNRQAEAMQSMVATFRFNK